MKIAFLIIFSFQTYAKDIVMKHMKEGDQCIICHRRETPNILLFRDGSVIPKGSGDLLCGQCHGTKHKKWVHGSHGKVVDSWMPEKRRRQSCIECHDPHSPKFPNFEAKAPPKTLVH